MNAITNMTNNQVIENALNAGQEGYVEIMNSSEDARCKELMTQFYMGERWAREIQNRIDFENSSDEFKAFFNA